MDDNVIKINVSQIERDLIAKHDIPIGRYAPTSELNKITQLHSLLELIREYEVKTVSTDTKTQRRRN